MHKPSQSHYLVFVVYVRSTLPCRVRYFRVVIRGYHGRPGNDSVIGFQFPNNWFRGLLALKMTETAKVKLILVRRWHLDKLILQFANPVNSWSSNNSLWKKRHRLIWCMKMWSLQLCEVFSASAYPPFSFLHFHIPVDYASNILKKHLFNDETASISWQAIYQLFMAITFLSSLHEQVSVMF